MRRVVWLAGIVGVCFACGSSESSDDSTGGTGLGSNPTPEEIAAALARAICRKTYACCDPMERARRFQSAMFQPTDEASCFDATISFWDYTVVHNAALEATGLMEFNPELASACLTEFNALRCDEWLSASGYLGYSSPIASCAAVFRGLVPVGGDCTLGGDYLCESGHCDIIGTNTCLASAGPGEACLQETGMPLRCRAGLACLPPEPTTCQALPLAERECNGI